MPNRDIRLLGKKLGRPIITVVIDNDKMLDAQRAVMLQEIGKTGDFISQRRKTQDRVWVNPICSINDKAQLSAFAP
jgi:hypothetical protein